LNGGDVRWRRRLGREAVMKRGDEGCV